MPTFAAVASTIETPVLIVGAGPTGLALAADLGWRGVPCLVIEERAADAGMPRASSLDVPTMEWLRRAGIAEAVRKAALPDELQTRHYCTGLSGFEIARLDTRAPATFSSPECAVRCSQLWLDPILRELAASHADTDLRSRWRLEGLQQRGDCILAEVSDLAAIERRRIAAQYVVDCSGAGSTIREAHGLRMDSSGELEHFAQLCFRAPGLSRQFDGGPPAETVLVDARGMWRTLESLDGRDLFRLRLDGEQPWNDFETIASELALQEIAGYPVVHQLLSRGRWRSHNALAVHWREGNILLAGDAAHQAVASSGIGLGLGIADAIDLAWKLEARLAGWGASGIVDAYEAERRPVVQRQITALNSERQRAQEERALELHADIARDTAPGGAARKALGKALEEHHARAPEAGRCVAAATYSGSPLITGHDADRRAPPLARRLTALLGARAPHAVLPGGMSTLDHFGRGFVLLRLGTRAPEPGGLDRAFAHRSLPLSFRSIDDPAIERLHGTRLVLVRPDGHVAWAGDVPPDDPLALADRVRGAA